MAAFLEDSVIIENKQISSRYWLMTVKSPKIAEEAKAGQFCMLKPLNEIMILRRPISIHSIDKENGTMEYYYEVVGNGTKEFSELPVGASINVQGPLGRGFTTDIKDKNVAVIGGGCGIAPLKQLIKEIDDNNNVTFIAGGRDCGILNILDNFIYKNDVAVKKATDDGSEGIKGNTVDVLKEMIKADKIDMIYTCGPHIMMEKVAEVAHENDIDCEVSLEERMACGTAACMGCSIPTTKGMQKVCKDGPVFDSREVIGVE